MISYVCCLMGPRPPFASGSPGAASRWCTWVCIYIYIYTHTYTYYMYMYIHIIICLYIYIYMYRCACIHMYIIYIYIYTHTHNTLNIGSLYSRKNAIPRPGTRRKRKECRSKTQRRKGEEGRRRRRGGRGGGSYVILVSVKNAVLRIRRRVGTPDLKAPTLGLECSFCCCVAWSRLT